MTLEKDGVQMYLPKELISIKDTRLIGRWHNDTVPVYEVTTVHGLNQIVGYVKHINSGLGTVLYRGQAHLHEKLIPSILHGKLEPNQLQQRENHLLSYINNILNDTEFCRYLNFDSSDLQHRHYYKKHVAESMLQHYGVQTHFQDFVDNHWVALWFGLFEQNKEPVPGTPADSKLNQYFYMRRNALLPDKKAAPECLSLKTPEYVEVIAPKLEYVLKEEEYTEDYLSSTLRENLWHIADKTKRQEAFQRFVKIDIANKKKSNAQILKNWNKEKAQADEKNDALRKQFESDQASSIAYVYLLLYVADTQGDNFKGAYAGTETITIDLRKALPSTFLRPCAQHGWTVRKIGDDVDISDGVVCVLRLSVELVAQMLGDGLLVSQENFFPPAERDYGYQVLLGREEYPPLGRKGEKLDPSYQKLFPFGTLQHFVSK